MKKLLFLVAILSILLVTGCRLFESAGDHALKAENVIRFSNICHVRDYDDLRGEGEDYLIRAFAEDSYASLILEDQPGWHPLSGEFLKVAHPTEKIHSGLHASAGKSGRAERKLAWAENAKRLAHNVRRHISDALLVLKPLLEDGVSEHQRRNTETIRAALDEITTFTRSFQRFTELGQLGLKLQDLIPSVEHCLTKTKIPENVNLIKDWSLNSVETQIEPVRFEEAQQNIVNNALDAMPGGGVLHVSVCHVPQHEGPQGELSVLVEVEDSGHGIPQNFLKDEIWQLFFTTKEGGTGTGIPTAKNIIESMGGNHVIESEEGRGTVVSIWLKGSINE